MSTTRIPPIKQRHSLTKLLEGKKISEMKLRRTFERNMEVNEM